MARMTRKYPETTTVSVEPATVGYIRLSVTDKDESCSVENQKPIIKHWAEQHQTVLSRFYVDENVSGSTFERKAFQEMISDITDSKIGCIIVKDLSRLG